MVMKLAMNLPAGRGSVVGTGVVVTSGKGVIALVGLAAGGCVLFVPGTVVTVTSGATGVDMPGAFVTILKSAVMVMLGVGTEEVG